ncbi:SRPBCC family protein [Kaarinaea lacus]
MANITHQIGVTANHDKIMHALTTIDGLSNWWTNETSGSSENEGIIKFAFNGDGPEMQVTGISHNKVEWKCISGPDEWLGTQLVFNLEPNDKQTKIFFSHSGWKEESPFHYHCSMKWAVFMLSLKNYLDTGKGNAFPNDISIEENC